MRNIFNLFLLSVLGAIFIALPQNIFPQELNKNIYNEEKILQLIKKFKSKEEAGEALSEIRKVSTSALPYLVKGMKDKNSAVRKNSVTAVGIIFQRRCPAGFRLGKVSFKNFNFLTEEEKILFEKAFEVMLKTANDQEIEVRRAVACYLGLFGDKRAVPVLEKLLTDSDQWVRFEAYNSLWLMGHKEYDYFKVMTGKEPKSLEDFIELLGDTTPFGIYVKAENEIIKFGKESVPPLIKLASSDKEPARQRAISLLGEMKAEEAIPVFVDYLKKETKEKEEVYTQICCIGALFKMDTEKSIKIIEEYGLKHKNPEIRYYTAERMYRIINPGFEGEKGRYPLIEKEKERLKEEAKKVLIDLVKEVDVYKKLDIGILLINNKEKEGIDILIDLLKERGCFKSAKMWLESVTKQDFGDIPPVVSKKMLEQYINKWKDWWEKNKDTFEFK